mmetsp:Transcript_36241/g.85029  ORF Transcript_36241/g.85029 Transcript_36241/m.85029 type:complete len:190 (+) Transcript_36241:88-657(+)|eukprot:CAMPEP_0178418900 /NCGR_PEP_ID=MMETSP0689_2-20121128/25328_1 /TAXON_ID=160604 /ORGANISM="Amphidinium massartii, Strain CS-259" /LENGTH=189 /DNA_ID=CAMNT_0020040311 /DNA_START=80 /DNA_END=649 /DNA_ORIENTATION=-
MPAARRCTRPTLVASAAVAFVAVANLAHSSISFATPGLRGGADAMSRRMLVVGPAASALLTSLEANAIPATTDVSMYILRRKQELVPVMKQGIDYLERKGIDERMKLFLPRLVRKMKIYADIFKRRPQDPIIAKLERYADEVEKLVLAGDKEGALAAFENYRLSIPPGDGSFDFKDPSTYTPPPEPEED